MNIKMIACNLHLLAYFMIIQNWFLLQMLVYCFQGMMSTNMKESDPWVGWGNENIPIALLEWHHPPPNSGLHTGNDCHLRKDTGENGLKYLGQGKITYKNFHLNCKMLKIRRVWQISQIHEKTLKYHFDI